jgi:hypothetical protein
MKVTQVDRNAGYPNLNKPVPKLLVKITFFNQLILTVTIQKVTTS